MQSVTWISQMQNNNIKLLTFCRRIGENPVDVTQAMNPFKVSLLNDNNEPAQQIQRGDPYFFNVETSGKFPGKSSIHI